MNKTKGPYPPARPDLGGGLGDGLGDGLGSSAPACDRQYSACNRQAVRSVLLMSVAMLLLPLMDVIAKYLSPDLATGQIAWSRFLFQSLLLAPFACLLVARQRRNVRTVRDSATSQATNRWHLYALRGFLIAAATLCFFTSITRLPVADAIAIFFVEPLLLTLMSPFFLGETIGWRRLSAVITGFAGALIIIQPGATMFGIYAFLPLAAAACFAFYLILTRKLAQDTDPVLIQFYTGLWALLVMSMAIVIGRIIGLAGGGWQIPFLQPIWPTAGQWGLLALLGSIGCLGHLMVVHAFRYVDASKLAPLQYFEIVGAAVFGWYVFNDVPTLNTWIGIAIITGSGFYVYWRERRLSRLQ